MRILLDTHAFLWWIDNLKHRQLGQHARALIADPGNTVFVSAASVWEIAIKQSLGLLTVPHDIERVVELSGFSKLDISLFHGQQAGSLPYITHPQTGKDHKDPFDRMLISQAQCEGLYLMSKDTAFSAYAVRLIDARK